MYLSRPVILIILNHFFSGSSKCVVFPGHQNSCFSMSPTCVFFQVTHMRVFPGDPHACISRSSTCMFFKVSHMRVFQGHPHACFSRSSTCVLFQVIHMRAWSQTIEVTLTGLTSSLLVQHPKSKRLFVNYDPKIREVLHEADCMLRMGIQVDQSVTRLCRNKDRMKTIRDSYVSSVNLVKSEQN